VCLLAADESEECDRRRDDEASAAEQGNSIDDRSIAHDSPSLRCRSASESFCGDLSAAVH